MVGSLRGILRSNKGQALIELSLIAPLMILLAYGAIEVGSVISTYMTLTHTTREGANLASRTGNLPGDLPIDRNGADYNNPDDILDTIIKAAAPTMKAANQAQWRVIYTKIVQGSPVVCGATPCYIVAYDPNDPNVGAQGQIIRGTLNKQSKLGPPNGIPIPQTTLSGIQNVKAGQTFHVFEVFYDYAPYIITYVGKGINTNFYDRTIFTNVSGN